jgi:hypothetical protein
MYTRGALQALVGKNRSPSESWHYFGGLFTAEAVIFLAINFFNHIAFVEKQQQFVYFCRWYQKFTGVVSTETEI